METNLVVSDDEYHQNECIQRKHVLLNALYILSSCSFIAKMISKGRSILMLPNVQLHMYLSIYPIIVLILFCNDHYLTVRIRWQAQLAYMGEGADMVKEKMYFVLAFLSLVSN